MTTLFFEPLTSDNISGRYLTPEAVKTWFLSNASGSYGPVALFFHITRLRMSIGV